MRSTTHTRNAYQRRPNVVIRKRQTPAAVLWLPRSSYSHLVSLGARRSLPVTYVVNRRAPLWYVAAFCFVLSCFLFALPNKKIRASLFTQQQQRRQFLPLTHNHWFASSKPQTSNQLIQKLRTIFVHNKIGHLKNQFETAVNFLWSSVVCM